MGCAMKTMGACVSAGATSFKRKTARSHVIAHTTTPECRLCTTLAPELVKRVVAGPRALRLRPGLAGKLARPPSSCSAKWLRKARAQPTARGPGEGAGASTRLAQASDTRSHSLTE